MRYVYSLVRFVPEPASGEFVVIGAIAGSDESSDWQIRQVSNPKRARAIDRAGVLNLAWTFFDRVGLDLDRYQESADELLEPEVPISEAWLRRLSDDHNNIIQLTAPTPMVAETADDALDVLFEEAVIDPARPQYRFKKKLAAIASVRAAFRRYEIASTQHLRERVTLHAADYDEPFDFAFTNGRVLQLVHTWSFEIPDQVTLMEQVKAWGWTVERLRESGGMVATQTGERFDVDHGVEVQVSFVPPAEHRTSVAFAEAMGVFSKCDVRHVSYLESDVIGLSAKALLAESASSRR